MDAPDGCALLAATFFETDSDAVLKTDGQRYEDETAARAGLFGLLQGLQAVRGQLCDYGRTPGGPDGCDGKLLSGIA